MIDASNLSVPPTCFVLLGLLMSSHRQLVCCNVVGVFVCAGDYPLFPYFICLCLHTCDGGCEGGEIVRIWPTAFLTVVAVTMETGD